MEKRMSQKTILAISAAVVALIVVVSGVLIWKNQHQSYRSIKIVEMDGAVTIDREGISGLNASVNMNLVSGDHLATGEESYVVLRLDTDKYVMLGECGAMKVQAQGTEAAARTSIHLEAGSVLSEIQNPLGQDASYDIVTPNATMSVRGTVFEVRKNEKENGEEGTISVLVYDGCVSVAPDGLEPREYHAGEYTEFTDSASPKFLTEAGTITTEQMNGQMLERLKKIEQSGRTLNTDVIAALASAEPETPSVEEEQSSEPEAPSASEEETAAGDETASSTEQSAQPSKEQPAVPAKKDPVKPSVEAPTESVPESTEAESEEDDSDDDSSDRKPSKPKPKPTEPSTEDPTDPSEPTTEPEKPTEPTEPTTEPEKPTEPTEPSTEPEKPTEPDVKTYRVAYYLPYIALWGENQDGSKYSSIMDIAPTNYIENNSIESGSKLQKPQDITVSMTPEGWIAEKKDLIHTGWCTIDGKEWDYDKDVLTQDTDLYPIWQDSEGRKYYPCVYKTGTKTYPCNSIIENSTPELP